MTTRHPVLEASLRVSLFLAGITLLAFACKPNDPAVVGRWKNRTKQLLVVSPDLTGHLSQEATCTPDLAIHIHRDPFDAYAIRFDDNQSIYFPLAQRELFAPAEYFCSSNDSVPMCKFCRVEGDVMDCSTTDQKLTGRGVAVTHDCHFERVVTSTRTSTVPDAGVSCPPPFDAGGGCRPGVITEVDAGSPADAATADATPDAGADAGARD